MAENDNGYGKYHPDNSVLSDEGEVPAEEVAIDEPVEELTNVDDSTLEVEEPTSNVSDNEFNAFEENYSDEEIEEEEDIDPFFGDPEFELDEVEIVPVQVTKSYEGAAINSPISIVQGLSSHVIEHMDSIGITTDELERQVALGNADWVIAYASAIENTVSPSTTLESVVTKSNTNWDTAPKHEGAPIMASRTRQSFSKQNVSNLSGSDAMRLYDSFTSSGRTFDIPLWHSGIWLYIKRPTLAASLTLDGKITYDKMTMGRNTRGASFSNDEFFMTKNVLDFALEHAFDHSLKGVAIDQLRDLIDDRDIPAIAWGLALTEYPSGFPFEQVCVRNPKKCKHVTKEIVNLSRVHRVNNTHFTDEQRAFMSSRGTKHTLEQVMKYRKSTMPVENTFNINDNIKIVLKCPTVAENIDAGYTWANEIETNTVKAFKTTINDGQRQEFERHLALATRLRNYSHWVSKIVMYNKDTDTTAVIEDRDTIHNLLNKLSSERKDYLKVQEVIEKYIVESVNVVIGTPNYKCPSCNSFMMERKGPETVIIPWDAVGVFFSLQQFKITKNMQG